MFTFEFAGGITSAMAQCSRAGAEFAAVAVPSQLCSLLGVRGGVICAHDCSRISTRAQTNKPANAPRSSRW
jgi:hypothetical protein